MLVIGQVLRAYESWRKVVALSLHANGDHSQESEDRWCWRHYLSKATLRMMQKTRQQLVNLLASANLVDARGVAECNQNVDRDHLNMDRANMGHREGSDGVGCVGVALERPFSSPPSFNAVSAVNAHSSEECLVRACLTAGLFPKVW